MARLWLTRPALSVCAGALLIACGGEPVTPSDKDTGDVTDPGSDSDTDEVVFPNDDEGSLVLTVTQPSIGTPQGAVDVRAVFGESRRGIINLAECLGVTGASCVPTLPVDEDSWVELQKPPANIWEDLVSRNIGPEVVVGPYTATGQKYNGDAIYFDLSAGPEPEPGAKLDLSFGPGAWGEVSLPEAVTVPDPMVVTAPDVTLKQAFPSSSPVHLQWEPGEGDVYLTVLSTLESRLYLLEDDGSFDLDFSTFNMWNGDEVRVGLSRFTTELVDIDGHELAVIVRSDQWIVGDYREVTGTELIPADTCGEASSMQSVGPGSYWGTVEGYVNNHNPGSGGCTGWSATGQDGVVPYVVQPWERVSVDLTLAGGDAVLYLLEDCNSTSSCLNGSDRTTSGGTESITWFNDSDEPVQTWIVIDSYLPHTDVFTLNISSTVLQTDVLVDSCLEAMSAGPADPGLYVGDTNFFGNQLDPMGYCNVEAPGGDGLTQVLLQPGQTLEASVHMPGANPVLYVLYNCAIAASCPAGSDAETGANETVTYTNEALGTELVYLVVDSSGATGQYELSINIQ